MVVHDLIFKVFCNGEVRIGGTRTTGNVFNNRDSQWIASICQIKNTLGHFMIAGYVTFCHYDHCGKRSQYEESNHDDQGRYYQCPPFPAGVFFT